MTLSFTLEDGLFVAEFEATSRFNLHLERPASGSIYMKQKTVKDGSYVIVKDFGWNRDGDLIIDADCGQGAVYPKWIRLESAVEPSVAEVTFEDEQSGGGAGESTMEYLDVSEVGEQNITQIKTFAFMAKADVTDFIIVAPAMYIRLQEIASNFNRYLAFGIDLKAEAAQGDIRITINDLLKDSGFDIDSIPRITKEQFYSLEV